jgi:hypothetical protein
VTGPATDAAFDAEAAAAEVMAAMLPLADAERAGQARRYLKSDLDFLGVSVPGIRSAVTGTARSRPDPGRDGALAWARALWREPVHERRTAAIEVLRLFTPSLEPAGLALVEEWIRAAHGWAYVAAWTRRHLDLMSGVTFREAVRRLPPDQAARLRASYR